MLGGAELNTVCIFVGSTNPSAHRAYSFVACVLLSGLKLHVVDRRLTSDCCSCKRQSISFSQARQRHAAFRLVTRVPERDSLVSGVDIEVILAAKLATSMSGLCLDVQDNVRRS